MIKVNFRNCFSKSVNHKKITQQGLSLIEASMVLVLTGVVVAGVMAYYQSSIQNSRLENTLKLTMNTISTVNGSYANTSNYDGLTTKHVANILNLPVNSAEELSLPFNKASLSLSPALKTSVPVLGDFYTPGSERDSNTTHFMISLKDIPIELCPKLLSVNFGSQFESYQFSLADVPLGASKASDPLAKKLKNCDVVKDAASSGSSILNTDIVMGLQLVFK